MFDKNTFIALFTRILFSFGLIFMTSCAAFKPEKSEPLSGPEKAKKNIEEGRGVSLKNAAKGIRGGKTTYEFSTSNPLWRASLETLDFLPLTTVDYSGGVVITDWYSDGADRENSIKITIRFLSNEIRSDSLKITVHKKVCNTSNACSVLLLEKSKIKQELNSTILRKAALIKKEDQTKKN